MFASMTSLHEMHAASKADLQKYTTGHTALTQCICISIFRPMQVKAFIANRQGAQGALGIVAQGVGACRLSLMRSLTQSMCLSE